MNYTFNRDYRREIGIPPIINVISYFGDLSSRPGTVKISIDGHFDQPVRKLINAYGVAFRFRRGVTALPLIRDTFD